MTIFHFNWLLLALMGSQDDISSVPRSVVPRNELEGLVLRNPVGNGPIIAWLEAHAGDQAGLEGAIAKAGFDRLPDERGCRTYHYLRVVKANGQKRVASIYLCEGKKPTAMVLMTFPDPDAKAPVNIIPSARPSK